MHTTTGHSVDTPIECVAVSAYTIPTDYPESDGTLQWDSTTLVLVEVTTGDRHGRCVALCRHHRPSAHWGALRGIWAAIVGTRMGSDARSSVVDMFGRTHDIPNLFICDGSTFPTQGSANPGLTIQSLAARIADHLISEAQRDDVRRRPSTLEERRIRYDLSAPTTWGKGVPCYRTADSR